MADQFHLVCNIGLLVPVYFIYSRHTSNIVIKEIFSRFRTRQIRCVCDPQICEGFLFDLQQLKPGTILIMLHLKSFHKFFFLGKAHLFLTSWLYFTKDCSKVYFSYCFKGGFKFTRGNLLSPDGSLPNCIVACSLFVKSLALKVFSQYLISYFLCVALLPFYIKTYKCASPIQCHSFYVTEWMQSAYLYFLNDAVTVA